MISPKLVQLETSPNAPLLQRTTRRVSLTGVGPRSFAHHGRILDDVDAANDLVAQQQAVHHGTLRLSASVVFRATLLHRWLAVIPSWVCASPAYLAAHTAPAHPQDPLEHDGLSVVAKDLAEIHRLGLPTNDVLLIRQRPLSGTAIAPSPLVKEEVPSGHLERLFADWTLAERELFWSTRGIAVTPPKLRAWVAVVEQQIAGEPPW